MKLRDPIEWIAFAASSAVIVYAGFAAFDYALGPGLDYCERTREARVSDARSIAAKVMARICAATGLPNERRLGLHLADQSGDAVLVYYEPQNNRVAPAFHWLDEDHLHVDLGEVTWLTPQITELGHITISYRYSGAGPSLE